MRFTLIILLGILLFGCLDQSNSSNIGTGSNVSRFDGIITQPRAPPISCDTDGGINIYESGTVTTVKQGQTTSLTDSCIDEKNLYEQYCFSAAQGGGTTAIACLGACESGSCTRVFDSTKCKQFGPISPRAEEDTINLVIVGAGYPDVEEFMPWVKAEFAANFFSVEPWKSNQDAFNFYYVNEVAAFDEQGNYVPTSTVSLAEHCQKPNKAVVAFINGNFDSEASYPPTERALSGDMGTALVAARKVYEYTDGKGNFHPTQFQVGSRIIIHELGHSIGGLRDEYYTEAGRYSEVTIPDQTQLSPNCFSKGVPTTAEQCLAEAPWKDLIPIFPDSVGCFEGCYYKNENVYRPTEEGIMRNHDNEKFGLAEERNICCQMLERTRSVSGYCNLFNQDPLDLAAYCSQQNN
ncbi:MAG: M64 family metallopeptidase [Candidatus Micrarchaeota archaeon]|nr:M64 family metallopeptidase [Candidatus Micrarchaeota archaeon]